MAQQEPLEVTSEEFTDWIENRITVGIVEEIKTIREYLKDYLAAGKTLGDESQVSTDRVVGRIEGLTQLFQIFSEVKEDGGIQNDNEG